jgi:hypothetical protein
MRMNPSYNVLTVTSPMSVLDWFGTTSGVSRLVPAPTAYLCLSSACVCLRVFLLSLFYSCSRASDSWCGVPPSSLALSSPFTHPSLVMSVGYLPSACIAAATTDDPDRAKGIQGILARREPHM